MGMTPLREGLLAIYDDLAAEIALAAPVCELSGRCCRFKEYGHTLFISRPEAELLLEAEGLPGKTLWSACESGLPVSDQRLVHCEGTAAPRLPRLLLRPELRRDRRSPERRVYQPA